uniref:Integrase, catalytic region, zinc finger, CCHC-type, peptidase aspartic, catalytic n=1 Tax=Tanacetum cinerariifolium TaxID=118510 RepID=A0A699JCY4_TANCI|nr:hypothetical protein [Tanacetum cinerariifolium]
MDHHVTLHIHQQSEFSQPDTGLVVPVFQKGNDPIDAINHMMSFLNTVVTSRITTTAEVPLRKPIALESNTPKLVVTLVYSRKPKASRNNVRVSKFKHNKSLSANKKEPNKSWGSIVSNVPSSSIDECRQIIKTIHVDFDELTAMAYEQSSSGPALHEMTPATIRSRLAPNPTSSTLFVPPSRTDWDMLFQSLFDELLTPPPSVDHPASEGIALIVDAVAPKPAATTGSPSSTTVYQDAPSHSYSQTTPKTQSSILPNDVKDDNHDLVLHT